MDLPSKSGVQQMQIIRELDIYNLVFKAAEQSRNKEIRRIAEDFKSWLFEVLKGLRVASGLEGFQIFRMLDKQHQMDAMRRLRDGLGDPVRLDFIKANTITNKAVSTRHGYPKMLKKEQMTPDMLVHRQPVLDDTVNLMAANDAFDLGLPVSQMVYTKYAQPVPSGG